MTDPKPLPPEESAAPPQAPKEARWLREKLSVLQHEQERLRDLCQNEKPHDHGLLRALEYVMPILQEHHDALLASPSPQPEAGGSNLWSAASSTGATAGAGSPSGRTSGEEVRLGYLKRSASGLGFTLIWVRSLRWSSAAKDATPDIVIPRVAAGAACGRGQGTEARSAAQTAERLRFDGDTAGGAGEGHFIPPPRGRCRNHSRIPAGCRSRGPLHAVWRTRWPHAPLPH
jgi:hypothetical protein